MKKSKQDFPFRILYDRSPHMLFASHVHDDTIFEPNKRLLIQLGFTKKELSGKSVFSLFHPDSVAEAKKLYAELKKNLEPKAISSKLITKNHELIDVFFHADLILDESGKPIFIESYFHDISSLKQSESTLNDVLEASPYGVLLSDSQGKIMLSNQMAETIFGYSKSELLTKCIEDLMSPEFRERHISLRQRYAESPRLRKMGSGLKITALHKEGRIFPVDIALNTLKKDNATLYLSTIKDISQEHKLMHKIETLAKYDTLTHLPNRAHFNEVLKNLLSTAKKNQQSFALLLMDLEHFKSINDLYGQNTGDQLLTQLANRCKKILRKEDFFARIGGDEFAILLEDIKDPKVPEVIAKKLIEATQIPFLISSIEIRTSLSLGIVIYPAGAKNEHDLLKNADIALFQAKKSKAEKYCYFAKNLLAKHMKYLNLQNGLLSAIYKNEFYLVYQPQVDIRTQSIIGIEALLRWKSSEFGLVMPDDFIPIAEKSGQMIAIGDWVFEHVCKQIQFWKQEGINVPKVSINISSTQLIDKNLPQRLLGFCKHYDIKTTQIDLEITETAIMNPMFNPIVLLNELDALGFYLSIDDFGVGYSSLSRLSQLPIGTLKIDKSFMQDFKNKHSDIVIKSILDLAQNLQLEVIAEGIEKQETHDYLMHLHCSKAQGYYYHRPLEEEKIRQLISS